jgi:methionyl aminopeptidase
MTNRDEILKNGFLDVRVLVSGLRQMHRLNVVIESFVKPYKLGIVRVLSGHGVGRAIHEDPYVPNYGRPGRGEKLVPGMVIAIEPMLTRGSEEVVTLADGFTIKTVDNSRSAHFEHTVLITETGEPEILTK